MATAGQLCLCTHNQNHHHHRCCHQAGISILVVIVDGCMWDEEREKQEANALISHRQNLPTAASANPLSHEFPEMLLSFISFRPLLAQYCPAMSYHPLSRTSNADCQLHLHCNESDRRPQGQKNYMRIFGQHCIALHCLGPGAGTSRIRLRFKYFSRNAALTITGLTHH